MLNQNLVLLRKKRGMTQEEVAEKVDVSRQAIAKWEAGTSMPNVEILCRLSDLYEITVDELLGRKNACRKEDEEWEKEVNERIAIAEELLKYSKISREKGLLAMEELARKEGNNKFLKFSICFLLDQMQKGVSLERVEKLLQNYGKAEAKSGNTAMVIDALFAIVGGEDEGSLRELIASHLGADYRDAFIHAESSAKNLRNAVLESYNCAAWLRSDTHLLDEMLACPDQEIQIILRGTDNKTLIHALSGAGGAICRKFLSNIAPRLLFFIDEDIKRRQCSEQEILEAQKSILETAKMLGIPKAEQAAESE